MTDIPLYLTAPEAAKLLRVTPERVRRWIERGELKGANLGDKGRPRYRIARPDLLAFLENRSGARTQPSQPRRRKPKTTDEYPGPY